MKRIINTLITIILILLITLLTISININNILINSIINNKDLENQIKEDIDNTIIELFNIQNDKIKEEIKNNDHENISKITKKCVNNLIIIIQNLITK